MIGMDTPARFWPRLSAGLPAEDSHAERKGSKNQKWIVHRPAKDRKADVSGQDNRQTPQIDVPPGRFFG